MVMENEIRLGDILDKLTPSDRVVIYNAAGQVVYRGYAANAVHGALNPQRRIKKMGLGMETYRATEQMWDWAKTDSLPEQVPILGHSFSTGSSRTDIAGRNGHLHRLPVHIHGRTMHGLWYILEYAGLAA